MDKEIPFVREKKKDKNSQEEQGCTSEELLVQRLHSLYLFLQGGGRVSFNFLQRNLKIDAV